MTTPRALKAVQALIKAHPWTSTPLIVGAPMKVFAGPSMAVAVSSSGGLGFVGPGAKSADMLSDLETVRELLGTVPALQQHDKLMPVGIGFQTWTDDIEVAVQATERYSPCAVWLFAPRHGQTELDEWTVRVRKANADTKIWIQVGTLNEAVEAASSSTPPDVLVIQGSDAGGHGRAVDGASLVTLLPEIADALEAKGHGHIPLIAAGGIADGRGVAAALCLGASGIAMGTRLLAAREARIARGYQDEVVRARNGAVSTVRTQLYNHLRGTTDWPEAWSPRTVINRSYVEQQQGKGFDELKRLHAEAVRTGDAAWGPEGRTATYAGTAVGLIHEVQSVEAIVVGARNAASRTLRPFGEGDPRA